MVMVEALACGTPVIAFPEGAASELVVDGQTGFLVEDERGDGRRHRPAVAGSPRVTAGHWVAEHCDVDVVAGAYERAYRAVAPARERDAWRVSERTLSVLDGSTFVVGDRLGDVRDDEGREHGFFSRGHALPLALGPARRRRAAGAARPRPGSALRRPVLPDAPRRPGRPGAVLDHAPPPRRPRVDGGDHRDQPPPREQPSCRWRSRSTPTSPTCSRSRTARSPRAR